MGRLDEKFPWWTQYPLMLEKQVHKLNREAGIILFSKQEKIDNAMWNTGNIV
jgi:hypothetical protein